MIVEDHSPPNSPSKERKGTLLTPHLPNNPIHSSLAFLHEVVNKKWDAGNAYFPSTSMQISNIHAGTGSNNIIPGELVIQFNFCFSNELTEQQIRHKIMTQDKWLCRNKSV